MQARQLLLERESFPAVEVGVGCGTMAVQAGILIFVYTQAHIMTALVATLASLITIDAVSYVIHWAFDTYEFRWNTHLYKIAQDFKSHHEDYQRVVRNGPFRNGLIYLCVLYTIPMSIISLSLCDLGSFGCVFWAVQALCSTLVPDVHRLAHCAKPPKVIRFLHRRKVLLPPRWHRHHHPGKMRDHRGHWALFNGWTNHLLDRVFK